MTEPTALNNQWTPSVQALVSRYYPNYPSLRFAELLNENISPGARVLEIGAGSGRQNQNHFELRAKVARYAGVDPDAAVLENPFLDDSLLASAEKLPFVNESFDVVFHNFVAEHFESPLTCNREIFRILAPGGVVLFQTPSRYYYTSVAASLTPHWFHEFYVGRLGSGRNEGEVFPTYYRLNDAKTISRQMIDCGFLCPEIEYHSLPPGYLRFNRLVFLAGVLFERTFERAFPPLRAQIIALARKAQARPSA